MGAIGLMLKSIDDATMAKIPEGDTCVGIKICPFGFGDETGNYFWCELRKINRDIVELTFNKDGIPIKHEKCPKKVVI